MRRLLIASLLLLGGCRTFVGPFQHRPPERIDDPLLSIPEQKQRGRDRLALPDQSSNVAPPLFSGSQNLSGRDVSPTGR